MRPKLNNQAQFDFQPSPTLKITAAYHARYERIDEILNEHPELVDPVHADIAEPLDCERAEDESSEDRYKCSSESLLRILICMMIEACSLREIVIRIDDSSFLRRFVHIYNDPMIDYTTVCRLKNRIKDETWKQVNETLARTAVDSGWIDGDKLRMDTTAVETNVHWPTDSSLLNDTYRTLARLLKRIRSLDGEAVGKKRLLKRKAKRLNQKIARLANGKKGALEALEPLYFELIQLVGGLIPWCNQVAEKVETKLARGAYADVVAAELQRLVDDVTHYVRLGEQVVKQAWSRVIEEKPVPNEEKIFSIFEPHTELLIRGKAGKEIEFGHMVQIEQVESKFITGYEVFEKRPVEHQLVEPAIENHKKLFGCCPNELAADKGFYRDVDQLKDLEQRINVVSICKKGSRTAEEARREQAPAFRHAQRFRAGVEGSISFLKRVLGLARCYAKGFTHYAATVGVTILAHNLLILARC